MPLEPVRYSATIFCGNSDLAPAPEIAGKLIGAYAKYEFIPATFHEATPSGPVARLRMAKLNNEWGLNVGLGRIDVEQRSVDKSGTNMCNLGAFCETAADLMGIFLNLFPRKGTRLATSTRGMFPQGDAATLADSYKKLSTAIPYYNERPPFEWSQRAVSRDSWVYETSTEKLNVISTISRAQGVLRAPGESSQFDRIGVEFDINTDANVRDSRFIANHLPSFLARAVELRTSLLSQIATILQ